MRTTVQRKIYNHLQLLTYLNHSFHLSTRLLTWNYLFNRTYFLHQSFIFIFLPNVHICGQIINNCIIHSFFCFVPFLPWFGYSHEISLLQIHPTNLHSTTKGSRTHPHLSALLPFKCLIAI